MAKLKNLMSLKKKKVNIKEKIKVLGEFFEFDKEEINQSLIKRFEKQVEQYPNNIAVNFKNNKITYIDLNKNINIIARNILDLGLDNYNSIGILFNPGIDMIKGMLSVLKSGKYYIPLDPNYPFDRTKYMLEDSNMQVILTNNENMEYVMQLKSSSNLNFKIVNLDDLDYSKEETNLDLDIDQNDIAYILYTSGSTGLPKGVIQTQMNVLHFIRVYTNNLKITSEDKITLFASYCFDAAVMDIYGALLNGATLFSYDVKAENGLEEIRAWILDEEISIFHSTPTLYRYFIETLKDDVVFDSVRLVVMGGEAVYKNDIESYNKYFNDDAIFINGLGPTESTVTLQNFIDKTTKFKKEVIPVGKPVEETTVYLLNENDEEVKLFEIGEIVYKSDYLAKGYLNQEEKTEEVFTIDPITNVGRVYRTGDLGKKLQDGSIEFVGRKDHQVKIRGIRIELGEIESCIDRIEEISKSIVVAIKNETENILVVYYRKNTEISEGEIKENLIKKLPTSMIPTKFIEIEEFPMTASGKIDRAKLSYKKVELKKKEYVAPVNELEKSLKLLWEEVLGIEEISTTDNFFELGGQSLKAILLVSKIHKELELELPLNEIFNKSTIIDQAKYLEGLGKARYLKIDKLQEKEYYEVSSAQRRMYLLNKFAPNSVGYNITNLFLLEGKVNIEKIKESFKELIKRHEILKTNFSFLDGTIYQKVNKNINFEMNYIDVNKSDINSELRKLKKPFDLEKDFLMRVALLKLEENKHVLFVDVHHIISDGTSIYILIKDFIKLYNDEELKIPVLQYYDYAEWQHSDIVKENIKVQEEYWLKKYFGEIPILDMPLDYKRPTEQNFEGNTIEFKLEGKSFYKFKEFIKRENITANIFLLAALNILLSKYTGQEDIIIGLPVSGRANADTHNIAGMFINTISHRSFPKKEKNIKEYLLEVKKDALNDYTNQDYQFEDLIDKIEIKRDFSRNPLFDVMLNMKNFAEHLEYTLNDLKISSYKREENTANLDLTLNVVESETVLNLSVNYCIKLFKEETIKRMINQFLKLLEDIPSNLSLEIKDIEIVTELEKKILIEDFNKTELNYNQEITIVDLLIEQTKKNPLNIAFEFGGKQISYEKLNDEVNKYASYLKDKGVSKGDIIAVLLNRSIEMVVSILGIMKTGAAYLPLDITYPAERLQYMLEDSKAKYLISTKKTADKFNLNSNLILKNDIENNKKIYKDFEKINSLSTAYVIYTSGSTGKPKGVVITHKNVLNFIESIKQYIDFKVERNVLFLTTISFDISVLEMFVPLSVGAKVVIAKELEQLDPKLLFELIKSKKIDILQITPSRIKLLMTYDKNLESLLNVKEILIGGETFPNDILQLLKTKKNLKIFNVYGPTETTVWSTIKELTNDDCVSIGKPIGNTQIYIYDEYKNILPIGVPGLLHIGGDGVSNGYLFREDLTKEKFVKNPLNEEDIIYNTGDYAKWLPNGEIDFIGRKDNQVKIRGFRVELGEIEELMLKFEEIKQVVVVVKKDEEDEDVLCAYYVTDKEILIDKLRDKFSKEVPRYMIPRKFIELDKIPLTDNGKIDRNLLPNPNFEINNEEFIDNTHMNYTENIVLELWKKILKVNEIRLSSNFFEIGGNSLSAVELKNKILEEFHINMPIGTIFENPILKDFVLSLLDVDLVNKDYDIILLNKKMDKNLFCFAPFFEHGAIYFNKFCDDIDNFSIYAFKYFSNDTINEYIKLIKEKQAKGPYFLMGYSSGGNIAFQVAKKLEELGEKVSKIILIDPSRKDLNLGISKEKYFKNVILGKVEKAKNICGKISEKLEGVKRVYNNYKSKYNKDKLSSNIILFVNENYSDNYVKYWKESTTKLIEVFTIKGNHHDVLKGSIFEKNIKIIKNETDKL